LALRYAATTHLGDDVKKRKVAVIFVAAVLVLALAAVGAGLYIVNRSDNPVETITRKAIGGGGGASDSNTISIYAPSELSKPLERITSTFQQEQPGTTFQFTLGPTSQLSKRVRDGEKPSLYIDTTSAVGQVPANTRRGTEPVAFGYDGVQLAVKRDNPKKVKGLDGFAGSPDITTGICAPELLCGRAGAQALQRAGITASPTIVTSNIDELTEGVKTGRIDAVLLLRTDLRRVLKGIATPALPAQSNYRVDYQMLQLKTGGPSDLFVQWLQGSPSARQILRLSGMLSFYE
jgi:molybdate transport system substrate-binding protein